MRELGWGALFELGCERLEMMERMGCFRWGYCGDGGGGCLGGSRPLAARCPHPRFKTGAGSSSLPPSGRGDGCCGRGYFCEERGLLSELGLLGFGVGRVGDAVMAGLGGWVSVVWLGVQPEVKGVGRVSMILAVSMEMWVIRLIMEMKLSPVSSNHMLGSSTMPLSLSVLM